MLDKRQCRTVSLEGRNGLGAKGRKHTPELRDTEAGVSPRDD